MTCNLFWGFGGVWAVGCLGRVHLHLHLQWAGIGYTLA